MIVRHNLISFVLLKNKQKGFTLLELLLASFMTLFVVSATGWGLIVMLRENVVATASSDIQVNLNRAVEFMADETKSASSVYNDLADILAADTGNNFNESGKTVVLALDYGLTAPIIYYFQSVSSSNIWLGPNMIYRWGPTMNNSGAFTDSGTPSTWQYEPFVDTISVTSDADTANCPTTPSAWTPIANTNNGFFVCVSPDQKQVEIHAYASQETEFGNRGLGTTADSRYGDKSRYSVVTQVFARSTADVTAGGGTNTLTIIQPAAATLARTSGTCTNYSISANTGSRVAFSDGMSIVLQETPTPILNIYNALSGGTALNFDAGVGNANQAQYSDGSCTILTTLTTP